MLLRAFMRRIPVFSHLHHNFSFSKEREEALALQFHISNTNQDMVDKHLLGQQEDTVHLRSEKKHFGVYHTVASPTQYKLEFNDFYKSIQEFHTVMACSLYSIASLWNLLFCLHFPKLFFSHLPYIPYTPNSLSIAHPKFFTIGKVGTSLS